MNLFRLDIIFIIRLFLEDKRTVCILHIQWRSQDLLIRGESAYFGQNSYFKAIIHQFKVFKISLNVLNRINEVQQSVEFEFCSIHINVTKYDVIYATVCVCACGGGGGPRPPP